MIAELIPSPYPEYPHYARFLTPIADAGFTPAHLEALDAHALSTATHAEKVVFIGKRRFGSPDINFWEQTQAVDLEANPAAPGQRVSQETYLEALTEQGIPHPPTDVNEFGPPKVLWVAEKKVAVAVSFNPDSSLGRVSFARRNIPPQTHERLESGVELNAWFVNMGFHPRAFNYVAEDATQYEGRTDISVATPLERFLVDTSIVGNQLGRKLAQAVGAQKKPPERPDRQLIGATRVTRARRIAV